MFVSQSTYKQGGTELTFIIIANIHVTHVARTLASALHINSYNPDKNSVRN